MNNLAYHGGMMLKRRLEASGRTPTLEHYAVALVLVANEQHVSMDQIVTLLGQINDYDIVANRLDRDARIRQLGF